MESTTEASYTRAGNTDELPFEKSPSIIEITVSDTPPSSTLTRVHIDWLVATWDNEIPQTIMSALNMPAAMFTECVPNHQERGRTNNRWDRKFQDRDITLFYSTVKGGCRLEMNGKGCRQWDADHPDETMVDLLTRLSSLEPRINRIDIAHDDFQGLLCVSTINRYRENDKKHKDEKKKLFTYHGRCSEFIDRSKSEYKVETVLFGSPKSDFKIKFYNKGHQLQLMGYPPDPDAPTGDAGWVRAEVEARNESAQALFEAIATQRDVAAVGRTALARLDFKVAGADSNKSRWKTAPFWTAFLEGASRAPLSSPRVPSTLEEKRAWVRRQLRWTLTLLTVEYGREELDNIVLETKGRLRAQDLALLSPAKRHELLEELESAEREELLDLVRHEFSEQEADERYRCERYLRSLLPMDDPDFEYFDDELEEGEGDLEY